MVASGKTDERPSGAETEIRMTKGEPQLTRRRALAGAGAVGFAILGMGRGRSRASRDEYTNYTYAESDAPARLLVGWRSTYNGELVTESPADSVDDVEVPLIPTDALRNVLPGDEGTASVGLQVKDDGETILSGVRVWMRLAVRTDVDDVAAARALAGRITLDVRYDTGALGVGRCAGAESDFVDFGEEVFSGTFADLEATDGVASGIELDPGLFDNGCLGPDDHRCLTFVWGVPPGRGNVGKGGRVDFDVEFYAIECDRTENPFEGTVAT